MAVRSKRLWGPTSVTAANLILYTCPADETAIIKTITMVNNAAVANALLFRLNGTAVSTNLLARTIQGNDGDEVLDCFIVLQPGDVLRGIATLASVIVSGFGAELEGVAD